jgi:hypothetical protein
MDSIRGENIPMIVAGRHEEKEQSIGLRQSLFSVGMFLCVLSLLGSPALAAEFLGVEIDTLDQTYVVIRDVNVRSKPDTKAKRIDGLKKGQQVHAVGRYQGWLAVMRDGKPLGFTYRKYLAALINGALTQPVRGSAVVNNDGKCAYEIIYSGGSTAGVENKFDMADYDVQVRCERSGVTLLFNLFMFMTEAAYSPARPNIHQIGIDLLEIDTIGEYEESFTTNVFYDSDKGKAIFGEVTPKPYAGKPTDVEQNIDSVGGALDAAVRMALESWNAKAWNDLSVSLAGDGN